MAAVLKAAQAVRQGGVPTVFHMRDLLGEAQEVIAQARLQAECLLTEARETADRLHQEALRRGHVEGLEAGRLAGQTEGREQALLEARAHFDQDLKHLAETLAATLTAVNNERKLRLYQSERDLLEFAVHLARRVTQGVARVNPDVAPANLQAALALVVGRSDLTVRAHPEDLAALERFCAQLTDRIADHPHIRLVDDPQLTRGGVVLSSETGQVDATLEQQLDEITRALLSAGLE